MCDTIQKIWEGVEWTWFQRDGQKNFSGIGLQITTGI